MELTTLDRELLDGLQVLTDQEIGRVQAHLAAGLPMKKNYGWNGDWNDPACFGCLVGTGMSQEGFFNSRFIRQLDILATETFLEWAGDMCAVGLDDPLPQLVLDRLAALLDMEWSRRHPLPAESTLPQETQGRLSGKPTLSPQEAVLSA